MLPFWLRGRSMDIQSTSVSIWWSAASLDRNIAVKLAIIAALVAIDVAWIAGSDFEFGVSSLWKVLWVVPALSAVGWYYSARRPEKRFAVLCTETAVLVGFSAAAAVLSVLVTSIGFPLVDQELMALDAALGFDWLVYVEFVNRNAWLGFLSSLVYVTTLTQVAITVIALGFLDRLEQAQRFVLAVMLGALACIAISALLPSAGALGAIRPPEAFILANDPVVDLGYKQAFFDLRNGLGRFISLDEPRGLIAFPSYHCTLSVLIILAFVGTRFWFRPVLLLNVAVILSTPVDGGHHLVDVLGGIVVAFCVNAVAGIVLAKRGASQDTCLAESATNLSAFGEAEPIHHRLTPPS